MQNSVHGNLQIGVSRSLEPREFDLFRALIYQHCGISLGSNKATMLSTRLSRRMRHLGMNSFEAYYRFLQNQDAQSDEFREFINSVTTNKTSFFREIHHFDFLAAKLRASPRSSSPLRIWSSACSTGQEPYSIGMTVADALGSHSSRDAKILASDIDTSVLHFAQEATYHASTLEDVPAPFAQRFFTQSTHCKASVQVNQEVRNLIAFRCRNLIGPSWGIHTKFDFIFCRNVLIYFDHATQDQILRRFLTFLKPDGFLIVGHSEHLHWLSDVIEPAGQTVYRLKKGAKTD